MSHAEICPVCKGCGKIQPINNYNPQCTAVPMPEICHGCNGKGWIVINDNDNETEKEIK